jgi:hypothetical protein
MSNTDLGQLQVLDTYHHLSLKYAALHIFRSFVGYLATLTQCQRLFSNKWAVRIGNGQSGCMIRL